MVKALILEEVGEPFRLANVELASPIGQEVLVDVKASGLCQSDRTASNAGGFPLPAILGHEVSGLVTAVGPEVQHLAVGDHVVACLQSHCGTCTRCLADDINMCTNPQFVQRADNEPPRVTLNGEPVTALVDLGGFAEQILVHEHNLVRIDQPIPHEIACVLGCGILAGAGAVLNAAKVHEGATVAVYGCGGLGLAAIQAAQLAGASKIIAVDVLEDKLSSARETGATETINSAEKDPVAVINDRIGGADFVFDFVGRPEVTKQAYMSVGRAGELCIIGLTKPGATLEIGIDAQAVWNQVRIRPVFNGSTNFLRDIPKFVNLHHEGRFNLNNFVSRTISLEEVNEAYASMHNHVGRTVVTFA